MDATTVFGAQFFLSLVVFSLLARWHVTPRLADKRTTAAFSLLLFPHAFRHIGLTFLVPGLVNENLPQDFATVAAYGDFVTGLLAIVSLLALHRGYRCALALAGLTNVVGVVDLVNALSQASVIPQLGVTWFIPTFVVPALLVTHGMMITRLYCLARGRLISATGHSLSTGAAD